MILDHNLWDNTLSHALEGLGQCEHMPRASVDAIRKGTFIILAAWDSDPAGQVYQLVSDHSCTVFLKTLDAWVVVNESEDSTGHGCQCSGDIAYFETCEDAVRLGLDGGQRHDYSKQLEQSE